MVNVLFVCLGNICRSPAAEGVFRALCRREGLADHIGIDSAGTSGWNIGRPPDPRSQAATRRRGIDLSAQRARRVTAEDFRRFDYVVAMDSANISALTAISPADADDRIHLLLDFAPTAGRREIPDPYHGGAAGFETMLDLIELGAAGLLRHIRDRHFPAPPEPAATAAAKR